MVLFGIAATALSFPAFASARERSWFPSGEGSGGLNRDPFDLGPSRHEGVPLGLYDHWYVGTIPDAPFPIPVVDPAMIPPAFRRQEVALHAREEPGSVVVDTGARYLYFVVTGTSAVRYGIGVGREGFAWSGTAQVGRKAKWPSWRPPPDMLRRRPDLPRFMEGGVENPLGARALYLYQDGRDTLYRIHGTNEPDTIGQAVSSGCIRMLNEDVHDLYRRVPVGARVMVLPPGRNLV